MKTTFFLSVFAAMLTLIPLDKNPMLHGKVTDKTTGEPVLFATVALYKDSLLVKGTETDLDGKYFFHDLVPGTYDVEVSYVGFQNKRMTGVTVTAGNLTPLNIIMEESSTLTEELCIVAYRVPLIEVDNTTQGALLDQVVEKKSVGKKIKGLFKKKERKGISALPNKSISAIAATSAGVSVKSNSAISVRGSRADANYYYIDGVRVSSENAANMVPPAQITHIAQEAERQDVSAEEGYDKPEENAFISPLAESLSTFSLDVDKASYSNIRRMLNYNQIPPPAAVRVEEMVNYFQYDYDEPEGKHPIVVHHNYTTCPWNKGHKLLHLSMKAKEVKTDVLPPSNLVYLVDVSGSMNRPNKLPLVIQSLKLLVEQLRPEDRVAIVTYAGKAGVALPSTSAADKGVILHGLSRLRSGGGTAGAQGIITAYDIAQKHFIKNGNNRVILATDGDFNIGVSDAEGLEKLIEKKRETGIYLSVLGFGMGNYQDHKMQTLSSKGNGNHAYIDTYSEAKKVFVNEFAGTLYTVAKDVKIQIEFNPAHVQSYRLIGYENRMLAKEDFNDDKKDAGEVGAGHTVTAIYEIIPHDSDSEFTVSVDEKQMEKSRAGKQADESQAMAFIKCRYKKPDKRRSIKFESRIPSKVKDLDKLDKDIQFSIAVAEFGMNLSQSKYIKTADLNECMNRAMANQGKDNDGYRSEFVDMMKKYMSLNSVASHN